VNSVRPPEGCTRTFPGLVHRSDMIPKPIIVVETYLQSSSSVPDEITAQLTLNGG
jgi:hypothetical protein